MKKTAKFCRKERVDKVCLNHQKEAITKRHCTDSLLKSQTNKTIPVSHHSSDSVSDRESRPTQ